MKLDDIEESRHVEDRRMESGGGGGQLSAGALMMLWPLIRMLLRTKIGWAIIGLGVVAYLAGFNPLSLLGGGHTAATHRVPSAQEQQEAVRMKKVLASTEQIWSQILGKYGRRYDPPTLVLYRGMTRSGCGYARAQVGPFYCPTDKKIYLDLGFFEELKRKLGAPGDFAQAYVLAHEVGHVVQDQLGILDKVHRLQQQAMQRGNKTRANHLQIPVELQADCFAGVWGHYARSHLDPGDIQEAINAASKIGDDALQKQAQGYVVPDSFTHGTSRQRMEWFMRGFKSGDINACNTFR
ncbi:neutral zinc metallopeptidase [Nitratifractor sp.]|uniref:KPN_02809 family neutral zinc metallopeptidase n=1 Tax=Nitratifractor sp. TaxID=2268144 RepID=UPI0025EF29DD|nr:neutral zinc metallopeptidase [Nitratifractor sp.]